MGITQNQRDDKANSLSLSVKSKEKKLITSEKKKNLLSSHGILYLLSTVIYSASNQRILKTFFCISLLSTIFIPTKMAEVEVTPAAEVVSEEPVKESPVKDPSELKRKLHEEEASPEKKQKTEETITNGKEKEEENEKEEAKPEDEGAEEEDGEGEEDDEVDDE